MQRIGGRSSPVLPYSFSLGSVQFTDLALNVIQLYEESDLYPCGGFSSLSFVHEAAQQHNISGDTRPLIVIYVGDYDPAGVLIDKSLEREMRLHLDPAIEMEFRRIAINEEQVLEYDLPTKPRKDGDKRSLQVAYTVEAEAMPARYLRALLRVEVDMLLPENALRVAKVAEVSERQHLQRMARMFDGGQA